MCTFDNFQGCFISWCPHTWRASCFKNVLQRVYTRARLCSSTSLAQYCVCCVPKTLCRFDDETILYTRFCLYFSSHLYISPFASIARYRVRWTSRGNRATNETWIVGTMLLYAWCTSFMCECEWTKKRHKRTTATLNVMLATQQPRRRRLSDWQTWVKWPQFSFADVHSTGAKFHSRCNSMLHFIDACSQ